MDAAERPSGVSMRGRMAGYAVGGLGGIALDLVLSASGRLLLSLPLLLFAVYIVVATFVFGALLAARVLGFRVYSAYLIPVMVVRTTAGVYRPTWHVSARVGHVNASPLAEGPIRRQLLVFSLAGPATMLTVGLGATGAFLLGGLSLSGEFHTLLLGLGIVALTLQMSSALTNLLGGVPLTIPALWRGGPDADRICASYMRKPAFDRLHHLYAVGRRPRDWPRPLLDQALAYQDTSDLNFYASLFAILHAVDSGEPQRAGQCWERVQALLEAGLSVPPETYASTYLEGAAYVARYRGDAMAARQLLMRVNRNLVPWSDWLRAEAAVLLVEGHNDLAHQRATEALAALERVNDTGVTQAEREWLQQLLADARPRTLTGLALRPLTITPLPTP